MTHLEELPGRMDKLAGEIVALRVEMREQFSVVRSDIIGIHGEMNGLQTGLRGEMRALHNDAIAFARALHDEALTFARALHAEAMAQTRTLFEEAVDRIARTKEGQPARPGSPRRRAKKR